MDKAILKARIESLLQKEFFCTPEQLHSDKIVFSIDSGSKTPRISIMAYQNCVVVCTSAALGSSIQTLLYGKSRDEIFELPYVYGQTIHYVPGSSCKIPTPSNYEHRFLWKDEISSLHGLTGFDNSLAFDESGFTPTVAVCTARQRGKIIGVAGASTAGVDGLLEVGVDVLPEHRNSRLGSYLVNQLTNELLARDILPFYSASVTNLGSQMVASRCGYIPAWVDTFGNTLDGSSIYSSIVQAIPAP